MVSILEIQILRHRHKVPQFFKEFYGFGDSVFEPFFYALQLALGVGFSLGGIAFIVASLVPRLRPDRLPHKAPNGLPGTH